MILKCTHCKKSVEETKTAVYSRGDYDPFCCQKCHDEYFEQLDKQMSEINKMTDQQFFGYMMPQFAGQK